MQGCLQSFTCTAAVWSLLPDSAGVASARAGALVAFVTRLIRLGSDIAAAVACSALGAVIAAGSKTAAYIGLM